MFIDAKDEIQLERSEAYLRKVHIERIKKVYETYTEEEAFSKIVNNKDIIDKNSGKLSVQLFVKKVENMNSAKIEDLIENSISSQVSIQKNFNELINKLKDLGI